MPRYNQEEQDNWPVERRRCISPEEAEQIAERAAELAAEKVLEEATGNIYKYVGKSVLDKLAWVVGALICGVYFLGVKEGWWK